MSLTSFIGLNRCRQARRTFTGLSRLAQRHPHLRFAGRGHDGDVFVRPSGQMTSLTGISRTVLRADARISRTGAGEAGLSSGNGRADPGNTSAYTEISLSGCHSRWVPL